METMNKLRFNALAAFCILVHLTSCAPLGDNYVKPTLKLPDLNAESSAINPQWWTLYGDAELNRLLALSVQNNSEIKLAVARIEEADAVLKQVGATLFPDVSINANTSQYQVTERGPLPLLNGAPVRRNNTTAGLGASFEIDFWGKLRRAKEAARALALSSRFAKDTVDLSLKGLVASNYMALRSLQWQLDIVQHNLDSRRKTVVLTQQRVQGGIASGLDLNQAEAAYQQLRAQRADLERQVATLEHSLVILSGDLTTRIAKPTQLALPEAPLPPAGLSSELLDARPDLKAAEQTLIAMNANIGIAKANLYPSITLTAGLGAESSDLSNILDSSARTWNIGSSLYLPVFNSGRLAARVDAASAQKKQALAQYEAAVQRAFRETLDALVNLRQQADRATALAAARNAASQALVIAKNRYQYGYVSFLEVLDAERVYNDAALSYVQSQEARLEASISLFKALGGGWVEPAR